ncbi:MAG: NUDIX domain-containing protein [Candidatus Saccharimonadales bacterium]
MKLPIQIVNNDDEFIGLVDRLEADYSKIIYRVSGLWLTNSLGEVLMAQRKFTKRSDPGAWGPAVAGTLDEGETYESNIYKEAEEEIGLTGVKFDLGPKIRVTEPRNYFCQWFTVNLDRPASEFKLQEDEVEAVRWISKGDLVQDITEHPEKYIQHFEHSLRLLLPGIKI